MKKSSIVISHIIAWVILYLVFFVVLDITIRSSGTGWFMAGRIIMWITLILLPGLMIPFYAFYFMLDRITKGKRKLIWSVVAFLILLLLPLGYLILDDSGGDLEDYFQCAIVVFFFAMLGLLFRSFFNGIIQAKEKDILQKQHLETELNFLKGQISPHFLFNTLNNIDALIATDPDTASKSLISLSDSMRYMIYETAERAVPLSSELEYLENVIALYKLRYTEGRSISYKQEGNAENDKIAPMLLIPVVENAFKHYSEKLSREGITISVVIGEENLVLLCSNAFNPVKENNLPSGIGLQTLKRRLDLLYPDLYELEIQSSSPIFRVKLSIPLHR
jgi:two-component system LytT family sensor kinase